MKNLLGLIVDGAGTPESIAEFLRDRRASWDRVMKELDVQPQ